MKLSYPFRVAIIAGILVPTIIGIAIYSSLWWAIKPPINVGILHSLSGYLEPTEKPLLNAIWLAINEINQEGGLLGRLLKPIVVDGMSNSQTFAQAAQKLIMEKDVAVLFGCWTSAARKQVKKIVEQYNKLLFYYVPYEGLETSNHIVYLGPLPNQYIVPGIWWALHHLGKRFFLIGNTTIFSSMAHIIIKDVIATYGGEVIEDCYISGSTNSFDDIAEKIKQYHPDVIINTMLSSQNTALFETLQNQGLSATSYPIISFHLSEGEISLRRLASLENHYLVTPYIHTLDTSINDRFVEKMRQAYGSDCIVGASEASAYSAVKLWARAVSKAKNFAIDQVRKALSHETQVSPSGTISLDISSLHAWRTPYLSKVKKNGTLETVWTAPRPIEPRLFPLNRTREQWQQLLMKFYNLWHQEWEELESISA